MSHITSNRRRPTLTRTLAAALVFALACLGLAACGGSSKSSSTSANAAATTPAATTPAGTSTTGTSTGSAGVPGPAAGRFKALRECLQKNGITLPKRTPGQHRPGGPGGPGGFLSGGAGGPRLPNGVTRAQFEAATKKCGGGAFAGQGSRLRNPAYRAGLAKFAACLRENGVNVPAPNTSGNGPIFDTKGLNTASATFRAAETKCRGDLIAAFRSAARGAGATGSAGGASG